MRSPRVFLAVIFFVSACALAQLPQAPDASAAAAPVSTAEPDFSSARKLIQQGQYDQALAELDELAQKHPCLKGLDRELAFARYGKCDYLCAPAAFTKPVAENSADVDVMAL